MRKLHAIQLPCSEIGDAFGHEDSLHEELLTESEMKKLGLRIFSLYEDEEQDIDPYLIAWYSYYV